MTMKDGFNRDCVDLIPVSIGNGFVEMGLAEHFVIFQNGELFGLIDSVHYRLHYAEDVTEEELNAYLDTAEVRFRCAIPSELLVNIVTMLESVYWLDKAINHLCWENDIDGKLYPAKDRFFGDMYNLRVGLRDAFIRLNAYH